MGYYTVYSLVIVGDSGWDTEVDYDSLEDLVLEGDLKMPSYKHSYGDKGSPADFMKSLASCLTYDAHKWYSYEEDMMALSKVNPETLFRLHGEGEERGDIWNMWFQNGKSQREEVLMTIPEYDPKKMK
tara:strand:- start:212 stop:595 length:384 start_codon:yes stop_codon:yes gene_type:complete